MNANDLCKLINTSVIRAHKRYLQAAGYAAMGIPESYIQSEIFISLSAEFGKLHSVIMEPRINQIQNGPIKGQRVDIAVLKKKEKPNYTKNNLVDDDADIVVKKNRIKFLIEIKRNARCDKIGSDIERIRTIRGKNRFSGLLVSYCSATDKGTIDRLITEAKIKHEKLKVERSKFIPSRNRKGNEVKFQSNCFIIYNRNERVV